MRLAALRHDLRASATDVSEAVRPVAPPDRRRAGTAAETSVALLVHALPAYRAELVELLRAALGGRLSLLTGDDGFAPGIRLGVPRDGLTVVENRFLFGRRLLWQRRCVRRLLRPDVAVLELNPRILSSWPILLLRRLAGRRTVLWGHAWPRGGPGAGSDRVRHVMRSLADAIVVYTGTQAEELRARMPGKQVVAAPNGIYPRARAVEPTAGGRADDFVFVGRLVDEKKPLLLLEAFLEAAGQLPPQSRLVFVGDGPLRPLLEHRSSNAAAADRVYFAGPITEFDALREVFRRSLASVVPGSAGLSLVQSLWFGVPVIVARDEAHGPELEAVEDGQNGILVDSNSPASLCHAILSVVHERARWTDRRRSIAATCVASYALEETIGGLTSAIDGSCR